ncbi:MAG: calcium-binding protein [Okeania sp. SIO2F4]|uniref:calcium-binding protein n=1 Tax=Okeania sp. SIO2F4 TaxID=2607790 RepID=UPI00142BB839|nr:calcium-binding protein [Okeania sp. SIO2F4]NES07184.1 calcium-binding protein [Okeania sp. SIO2F4]
MTFVVIPPGTETDPSVDVLNPDVNDGGRILVGTPGEDRLAGTSGSDSISALASNDLVGAGAGNDVVILGEGSDTAGGGTGNDSIQGNRGDDSILGGAGDDCLRGGRDNDTVDGGEGEDLIFGDRGDDIVSGGSGDDSIQGNSGVDFLEGNAGNDFLDGGKDSDSLDGGIGDDFLSGSRGNDVLTGGAGADDFFFWYSADGSYGVDTLTDFNRDEGDRIVLAANLPEELQNAGFNALAGTPTGNPLPENQFEVIVNFVPGVGNTAAIVYDPANGLIYYDPTPGNVGDENQFAQVDNTVYDADNPLENTDFEIF